jgi:DNA-binding NarL/FixJ family response regulator
VRATGGGPLEITIVDADPKDRHGIELVLRSWGHRVIGRAGSSESALDAIGKRRPQVALVGMDLADGNGIELVGRLVAADPDLGIVLVLGQAGVHELEEAMACGARGVVLGSGEAGELANAIGVVGEGGRYVAPGVERLARTYTRLALLSKREKEVLQLLADGLTGAQAAVALAVSPERVRRHIRSAMRKLRARTRVHAVTIALKRQEIRL